MTTYVFPGQGAQVRGMGKALFAEFPDLVQSANNILNYSIETLCIEDPNEQLNKTNYTQPALYVVNALSYKKKLQDTGKTPDYVSGHSLGEYNALLAAGVFDFTTGLQLVKKRGDLMSQATGGGMAAIVGLKGDEVQAILEENNLNHITIANYNSCKQIVISGLIDAVRAAEPIFLKAGATLFIPLKVSGAFHSPYMSEAQQEFADFLNTFTFTPPTIPVIANINAKPYEANQLYANLAKHIVSPVLWTQSIEYLINQGETVFEEIGPGKVLSGLISRIQKGQ